MKVIFTFLIILFALQRCTTKSVNETHDVTAEEDPEIYLLPGLDHGLLQSPINILSNQTVEEKHNITLEFNGRINQIENLGHTVQLDLNPGNTITIDEKTYEFKQIHFHTPSEHLIDGITFPMEVHVVNVLPGSVESERPEYAVISLLFKMGKENTFLKLFIDDIPESEDQVREVNLDVVKEADFFKKDPMNDLNFCYKYKGSLTTPPYTESVTWLVVKRIMEASPEQIMSMNTLEGDNARHIQESKDRAVID